MKHTNNPLPPPNTPFPPVSILDELAWKIYNFWRTCEPEDWNVKGITKLIDEWQKQL